MIIVKESDRTDLDGTVRSLGGYAWWRQIFGILFALNGADGWMGKGYGINLADRDGFQVGTREAAVAEPCAGITLDIPGQCSGVRGFVLWISLSGLTWAISMLWGYVARPRGEQNESALGESMFASAAGAFIFPIAVHDSRQAF